jgi:hypothetical protein
MKTLERKKRSEGASSSRGGVPLPKPFRLPPDDFDVRRASSRELALFGLPLRPDAETHLGMRLLWEELADRRPRFVDPRWKVVEHGREPGPRVRLVPFLDTLPPDVGPFFTPWSKRFYDSRFPVPDLVRPQTSNIWCGAYVKRPIFQDVVVAKQPHHERLRVVAGRWVVPGVSVPPESNFNGLPVDGSYNCGVWVGIDGTVGTKDVLQAGTDSVINAQNGAISGMRYYAWVEWFPANAISEGLAVNPGDLMSCTVCAPMGDATNGSAVLFNMTTNEVATYRIDPKPGVNLAGNVAEWIIESPGLPGGVGAYPLANFGQVVFTDCSAGTQTRELTVDEATFIDMIDSANQPRARAFYLNRSSLRCLFVR